MPASRPRRWRRLWQLLALLLVALLLVQLWFAAWLVWYRNQPPLTTAFMSRELGRLQQQNPDAQLDYRWVDYERISIHLKRAVLAAEDARFMEHGGVDWDGIRHALERNREAGEPVAGGSTVSQQLAKNLFLSGRRSYIRKGQELAITLMQEQLLDKRRILELYLNVAEWGEGIFGAEAAAWRLYGKPAAALGPAEAAELAARLPRPRHYHQHGPTPWLRQYSQIIQARMHQVQVP
ncbi:monofunctional biosynthetic peptidoglycan transglycosylase [Alcanivorax quisquiliarum]|uniref:Biosynthetic peptidoglycan transglycosylase n=1 Tax=Alcanivorax quisquiliarum TaxID=2933565 RepID=A0ABT0E8E2_9GAMM|nr:monofunctional biosynthetic peptidoglycan transglycosylase [Alcanivorax quisquiliarum]MCK0538105.1 monofunctional biosynthetic peptidoglycan transglycosylase [Alcanivorax quisquiliarum]